MAGGCQPDEQSEQVRALQLAQGDANKVWIVPAELTKALEGMGGALGGLSAVAFVCHSRSGHGPRERGRPR